MSNKNQKKEKFQAFKQAAYIRRDQKQIIRSLQSQKSLDFLDTRDEQGNSPIHLSVYMNHFNLLQQYIEFIKCFSSQKLQPGNKEKQSTNLKNIYKLRYFLNLPNHEGLRPIHYASYNGNIKMMKLLSQNGAKTDSITDNGLNIFHIASQTNQLAVFYHYLPKIDLSVCDVQGNSALHWACYRSSEKVVDFLLANNAQIDSPNNEGNTPLHIAVLNKRNIIVKKLLKAGANRYLKNKDHKSALDLASNSVIIPPLIQEKELCSRNLKYRKYIKKSKFVIFGQISLLEIIILSNLCIFCLYFSRIPRIAISICLTFFSLCIMGLFIKLTGILSKPAQRRTLDIEKQIDYESFCFYCSIQKKDIMSHCYKCKKCVQMKYKHCSITDNCIGRDNILSYILLNFLIMLIIGIIQTTQVLIYMTGFFSYERPFLLFILMIDELLLILFVKCILEIGQALNFCRKNYKKKKQLTILSESMTENEENLIKEIHNRKKMRWEKYSKEKSGLENNLIEYQNNLY